MSSSAQSVNPERIHFLSVSRCPAGPVSSFVSNCRLRSPTSRLSSLEVAHSKSIGPENSKLRRSPQPDFVNSVLSSSAQSVNPERIHLLSVSRCPVGPVASFEIGCALRSPTFWLGLARSKSIGPEDSKLRRSPQQYFVNSVLP